MSSVRIAVYVTPRSGRDEIVGWRGSELALRVTAPAEGGKANEAVQRLLAGILRVPKGSVRVSRGMNSRHKHIQVDGIEDIEVRGAFGQPGEGSPR